MAAAAKFDLSVLGDAQLQDAINGIEPKIRARLLRRSLRTAFKITLDAVKAAVPVGMGHLRRSIKLRTGKGGRGMVQFRIYTGGLVDLGARRTRRIGARGAVREGYYPAALEFGYARPGARGEYMGATRRRAGRMGEIVKSLRRRNIGSAGGTPERVAPRSFMRNPLKATQAAVIEAVRADLQSGLVEFTKTGKALLPGGAS